MMHVSGMRAGVSLIDMLNFDEHYATIERGGQSKLQFKSGGKQEVG